MNTPIVIADFSLESNVWDIEGRKLDVHAVSALHPYIQFGLEKDAYSEILGSELYGMIRSWRPSVMLITPTDPIFIVLDYGFVDLGYYTMNLESYLMFKDYFVGSGVIQNSNWAKEGF